MTISIAQLFVHPIKSTRAMPVSEVALDAMGPALDRRWMVVDAEGAMITQRTHVALQRVSARPAGDALTVSADGLGAFEVPLSGARGPVREVVVWGDRVPGEDCGTEARAFFEALLGAPCSLVRIPDDAVRAVDPTYVPDGARVGYADGYPLLVVSEASVADVASRAGMTLDVERFRPNIVVRGCGAFEEDTWVTARFGDVPVDLPKPCSRCVITTVDPQSLDKGPEPLRALGAYRKRGNGVYLAMNAVHRAPGVLRVGDSIEVVARRS